jgi:hypothetical protein
VSSQPAEKRSHERVPCEVKGYYQASGDGPLDCFWWWCTVRDISLHGCQLVSQRPLERGTPVTVDLAIPGSPTSCTFAARVVHSAAEGKDAHRVGCEFLRPLTASELLTLQAVVENRKGLWVQPGQTQGPPAWMSHDSRTA